MPPGLLVTFEGIDGCGKSTQASLFFNFLKKKKIPAVLLKEPGGTPVGERIRKILLQKNESLSAWCELFLYLASRAQLVEKVLRPALTSGKVVILDRHIDSTLAYQGYGRKLPISFIRQANAHFLGGLKPNLTFLLDASPEALRGILAAKKKDRMEQESLDFQKRVRHGYLVIARQEKNRFRIIRRKEGILKTAKKIITEWENFSKNHDW